MHFHLASASDTVLGTVVAAAIALVALAMLTGGLLPDGDAPPSSGEHGLAATLDRLGFAHAFAFGEVMQAASDAVRSRVIESLPSQAAL
jgi:hypothetical protein